jgi:hypothetical protein
VSVGGYFIGAIVALGVGLAAAPWSAANGSAEPQESETLRSTPRLMLVETQLTSSGTDHDQRAKSVRTTRIIESAAPGTTRVAYVQEEGRSTANREPVRSGLVQKSVTYALGGLLKLDDRHRRIDAGGSLQGDWYSWLEDVSVEALPSLELRVGAVLELAFKSVTEDFLSGASTRYRHVYRLEAIESMTAQAYWRLVSGPDERRAVVGDVWRFSLDWAVFNEAGDQLSRRVREYFLSSALGYVVPCCSEAESALQVLALVASPDTITEH